VKTMEEKQTIGRTANRVVGPSRVTNDLEIAR
jgi:hypothetical protein